MKNNFKKSISVLLSMLIAGASSAAVLTATADSTETPVEPTVYINTYDEAYVADYYGTEEKTKQSNYTLKKESDGNTYVHYEDGDQWNLDRGIAIYDPVKASTHAADKFTGQYDLLDSSIRYDGIDASKTTRSFKISLRYKATWVPTDPIGQRDGKIHMGLRLAHLSSSVGNTWDSGVLSICNSSRVEFFTIESEVNEWTNVEAYVTFNVVDRNWQYGLAFCLRGKGIVDIDDITVTDYTDTNIIFANLTVDGNEAGAQKLDSASDLPKYVDQKIVQGGWYTDEAMTEPFDFDSYDIANGRQISLYAKTAGIAYINNYQESYVTGYYSTDAKTKDSVYSIVTEEDGNVCVGYSDGEQWNFRRGITIYNPGVAETKASEFVEGDTNAARRVSSINYAGDECKTRLFKISLRYKATWVPTDPIGQRDGKIHMGLRLAHLENGPAHVIDNDISDQTLVEFFTIESEVNEWTNVEAYVSFDATECPWNYGLAFNLRGKGVVYLDDIKIEDYTNTDYSLVNTYVDGKIDSQVITPLTKFTTPAKEGYHWYNDESCTTQWTAYSSNRTAGSTENLSVNVYGKAYDKGDWNGDGKVDDTDFKELRRRILFDEAYISWLDMDNNEIIDICDLVLLKKTVR